MTLKRNRKQAKQLQTKLPRLKQSQATQPSTSPSQPKQPQKQQLQATHSLDEQLLIKPPEIKRPSMKQPLFQRTQPQQPQATPQWRKRQRTVAVLAIFLICLPSSGILWQLGFPWYIVVIPLLVLVLIGLLYASYTPSWSKWTGFGEYRSPASNKEADTQKAKTLWDWLQLLGLLAVPIAVAIASAWFSAQQNHDIQIAAAQRQQDIAITKDQQQQTTLETYLDRMQELLTNENLSDLKAPAKVRALARARTLTALSRLDPDRKGIIIQFLYEANLINGRAVVDLNGADLTNANLDNTNLANSNLSETDLTGAHLSSIVLTGADLTGADLTGAHLSNAHLTGAHLECMMVPGNWTGR